MRGGQLSTRAASSGDNLFAMSQLLREHYRRRRPGWQLIESGARIRDSTGSSLHSLFASAGLRRDVRRAIRAARATDPGFTTVADPTVSIVIPVYNNWALTRDCLASLCASGSGMAAEVIVVDDCSTDSTARSLGAIRGLRVVTNASNLGYTVSVNRGAAMATARYIVLLNNDTVVLPGWLNALVDAFDHPRVGAAGSRLIYRSGVLQDAGAFIWSDGTGSNVGRYRSATAPEYGFLREVDYCTGAALMVRADLWREAGGFDERFAPAYYEDTDICLTLRARGFRTVYVPTSTVVHLEGMTHGTNSRMGIGTHTKTSQEANRARFVEKWPEALAERTPRPASIVQGDVRGSLRRPAPRVLVCAKFLPMPDRDSGSQRMDWILRLLAPLCSRVTLFPLHQAMRGEYAPPLRRAGVDVITGVATTFGRFCRDRRGLYDVVVLSRFDVAGTCLEAVREHQPQATVLLDTVDIRSLRLDREIAVTGATPVTSPEQARAEEARMIRACDVTIAITADEAQAIQRMVPEARTVVLPNVHVVRASPPPGVDGRRGLLFVGSFLHEPNIDGVAWFIAEVLPLVRTRIGAELTVVGEHPPPELQRLSNHEVRVTGWVRDVGTYFDAARVFVAPLRFGAGMKGKVGHALSMGLPTVTTTIGAEGMDVEDGTDILIRDDAVSFADAVIRLHEDDALWTALSRTGRDTVRNRWSPAVMTERLSDLLHETAGSGPEQRA